MPLFRYRAVDSYGEPMEGTMEEESAHRVSVILQERGAQVNHIEEVAAEAPTQSEGRGRLAWEDVKLINDQLLAVARGKLPLSPSVNAMAKDLDNRRLRKVLDHLQQDLENGRTLEEAIARSPVRFPSVYVSLIRAGERTGNLAGVLDMLSSYSTRILDLRDRVFMAMVYPTLVLIVAIGALFNVLFYVVPEFKQIFDEFGSGLPAPTRFLVNISELLRENSVIAFGVIVGAGALGAFAIYKLRGEERGRAFIHRIREVVPVLGRTFRTITLARFSKSLSMLLHANVPVPESLDLASASAGNEYLRHHVRRASTQIAHGERIADAFADTGYFPHSYLWFLANGESRGQLPDTLNELSNIYEREVTTRDEAMLHLVMPVTILCLGLIVLFIVVSLYLPIFTLGDAISG